MEPVLVTRTIDLAAPPADVWASIGSAVGLSGWLAERVEGVEGVVIPGSSGTAVDGEVCRRFVITDVAAGRSLELTWWDEARPELASVVRIDVAAGAAEGTTTVTVSERLLGAAVASIDLAGPTDLLAADHAWDARLRALVGDVALLSAAA